MSSIGIKQIEQSAPRSTGEVFRNIPGIEQNLLEVKVMQTSMSVVYLYLQVDQIPTIARGWITGYAVWRYVATLTTGCIALT
jgi:hypothetical protein